MIAKEKNKKTKMLDVAISHIEKDFGKGSIRFLGDAPVSDVETISTGSLLLDEALGVGGLPKGRIIEIFGPEASGKTTLTLSTIAQAQAQGECCAFIDAEHSLDALYASKIGVKLDELVFSQPDSGEQALEIAERLIRSGDVGLLVIDSVAALVPQAEIDGEMGDAQMALQARLMSKALRKLTPLLNQSKTILIFINQIRQKINALPFGSKETTTGGTALKFYSSVRIDIRRIGAIKKGDEHIGNEVRAKVVKNKVAAPFRQADVDIIFGKGFSKEREILNIALDKKVITKKGSWFSFGDQQLAQGKESCVEIIKSDKELQDSILKLINEREENNGEKNLS